MGEEHVSKSVNLDGLPLDDRSLPFEKNLAGLMNAWHSTPYEEQLAILVLTCRKDEDVVLRWRDVEQGQAWAIGLTMGTCFLHWLTDHGDEQHDALSRAYPGLRQLEEQLAGFAGAMRGVGQSMGKI